jgi:hypothetical protein
MHALRYSFRNTKRSNAIKEKPRVIQSTKHKTHEQQKRHWHLASQQKDSSKQQQHTTTTE